MLLCPNVLPIPVKDKAIGWKPDPAETFPIIKEKTLVALARRDEAIPIVLERPFEFSMTLMEGYRFAAPEQFPWKGRFEETVAYWEAVEVEMGLELFKYVRGFIVKGEE